LTTKVKRKGGVRQTARGAALAAFKKTCRAALKKATLAYSREVSVASGVYRQALDVADGKKAPRKHPLDDGWDGG